ncbi:hypothetical protein ACFL6R_05015 [Gemmatimonadota bacterium]
MDPNLFHLDWARTAEVLAAVVILSALIERSLSVLFEWRHFIDWNEKTTNTGTKTNKGWKEPIAFAMSLFICIVWDFDAVSMIILSDHTTLLGEIVTAGILAGGSKGSLALFRTYLGIKSTYQEDKDAEKEKAKKEAEEAAALGASGGTP